VANLPFSERFASVPQPLIEKVNGAITEESFIYIGRCIADAITAEAGAVAEMTRILDFGCGMGRVLARMLDRAPQAEFVGFDIDPQMLQWCGRLVASPRLRCVSATLDQPGNSFDLVYAISVFTHLDETTEFWLSEIHRLLRPGGVAFLTYHDETLFAERIGGELKTRHVVGQGGPEGGAAMGTFYQTSHWESLLAPYYKVVKTAPRGLFGDQSYSVVRKKRFAPDRAKPLTAYAHALEKELFALRQAHAVTY
jgi:SAM-dependent methyltransferase